VYGGSVVRIGLKIGVEEGLSSTQKVTKSIKKINVLKEMARNV